MDGLRVFCLILVFYSSLCWTLKYTCYPDDTIEVSGLGAGTTGVFAKNADGVNCTTSPAGDTVNITGCDKDKFIVFSFGSYTGMLTKQIVGGSDITVVNITCNEIEATPHNISDTFDASIQFNETTAFNVIYSVSSHLNKEVANVGEEVVWSIHFPSDYSLEIHHCSANPGTTYNDSTSITLVTDNNTQIPDLISNFTSDSGVATATINAFKFYDNDDVFLYCRLTVCPPQDTSCQNTEEKTSQPIIQTKYLINVKVFLQTQRKRKVDVRGSERRFTAEIGQVLRIIDPNTNRAKPRTFSGLSISCTILAVLATLL